MPRQMATGRKSFKIIYLALPFHNFSTGIQHAMLKNCVSFFGPLFINHRSSKAGFDTPLDLAFFRFASINFKNIPGRMPGAYSRFIMRMSILMDISNIFFSVYEYYVKRYRNVLHPVMVHFIPVVNKEHAIFRRQIGPEHKTAGLFVRRYCRFSLESA